jgi:hypothetical protein
MRGKGSGRGLTPALPLALIHQTAWKSNSPKYAPPGVVVQAEGDLCFAGGFLALWGGSVKGW